MKRGGGRKVKKGWKRVKKCEDEGGREMKEMR